MKTTYTKLCLAMALAFATTLARAGFLFETAPAEQQTPVQARTASTSPSVTPMAAGRNVDMSAKVDRMAKMNRQRIDLESRLSSRITQSGETPAELAVIRGMGRDVTFEDALRQILPAGWSAYSDQDLPLEAKVSWSGNRTWPMVLHGLLTERDMRAHVDWKNEEVMFFVPAVKEELTKPVPGALGVEVRTAAVPALAASSASDGGAKPLALAEVAPVAPIVVSPAPDAAASAAPLELVAPVVATAPAAAAPVPVAAAPAVKPTTVAKTTTVEVKEVIWTLAPEHTLRENLRRWATAANWNLVWNAVSGDSVIDYPVDAKVEFSGELLGANGAMAKVITAYRDADFPLEIEFFRGNRVVEVRLHRIPDVKAASTDAPQLVAPRAPLPAKPAPQRPNTSQQDY